MRSIKVLAAVAPALVLAAAFVWWFPTSLSASASQQGLRALERGNVPLGMRRLADAVLIRPDSTSALYNLGLGLLLAGDAQGAEHVLRSAMDTDPRHPGVMNNLAVALARQGRQVEARDVLRRLVAWAPRFRQGHTNLAQLAREMGDTPRAIRHAALAETLRSDN